VRIKSVFTQGDLMKRIVEEERLKGIIQTAGAVCHEMNQPLQVISAISEIILLGIQEANPLYDNLVRMRDQVHRVGAITKKLQHITKYETKDYVRGEKIIDIDRASGS
jgi:C4-dicarboxylate-specific signal transduction histidine kinase